MGAKKPLLVLLLASAVSVTAAIAVSGQPAAPPLPKWNSAPVLRPASAREAGMDSVLLFRTIDSIIRMAIDTHAFPGCQLFVARGGKTVIDKSYGWHDYSQRTAVENDHLYDLASITKMAGATLAIAKLVEKHSIGLDDRFSKYYIPFRDTDKKNITLRRMLTHSSGFPSGIPRPWLLTRDSLLAAIRNVPLRSRTYRYSDLPFILFPEVVRLVDGRDIETFLTEEFYRPLGTGLTFNPLQRNIPIGKIAPTETDGYWRNAVVRGTVHDESAAVAGGVSGNAGLFGTARDLAVVMQMLLNGGVYDGNRYLQTGTVEQFTQTQYPSGNNRRALGFDKPLPGNDTLAMKDAYPAPAVSAASFGHPGFTGVFAWADPEYGLVYVLLCNRITPSRNNPAFTESRVRYTIQQAIYDAIRRFDEITATGGGDTAGPSTADGTQPRE